MKPIYYIHAKNKTQSVLKESLYLSIKILLQEIKKQKTT